MLRRAVELGVDHIDTSQFYGPDVVNELIHEALYPYPEGLKLVTKVGGARDSEGGWLPAQMPDQLRSGVEENLRTLQVERMDLVNLRLMDASHGGPDVPIEEQLGMLEDLRQEGKIDLIGVSNVNRKQLEQALRLVTVGEVQNPYSVVDRSDEELVELCAEHDVAFVPFFPLGSAFTGGPAKLAEDPALSSIAEKHDASASQIALAWLLARYEKMLLIPGTSSVAHLEENYAAIEIELDEADMAALESVAHQPLPRR